MSSNVKRILEEALELIRDPEHWCQGEEAQFQDGSSASYDDEGAVRFCMVGALRRADPEAGGWYVEALKALARFIPTGHEECAYHNEKHWCRCYIPDFNDADTTTHEDVVLTFKHAIHALEEIA